MAANLVVHLAAETADSKVELMVDLTVASTVLKMADSKVECLAASTVALMVDLKVSLSVVYLAAMRVEWMVGNWGASMAAKKAAH
jgi:hypothetical protein